MKNKFKKIMLLTLLLICNSAYSKPGTFTENVSCINFPFEIKLSVEQIVYPFLMGYTYQLKKIDLLRKGYLIESHIYSDHGKPYSDISTEFIDGYQGDMIYRFKIKNRDLLGEYVIYYEKHKEFSFEVDGNRTIKMTCQKLII